MTLLATAWRAVPPPQTTLASRRDRVLVAGHFVRAGAVGGAEHMLYNLLGGFAGQDIDLTVACSEVGLLDPQAVVALRAQPGLRLVETAGPGHASWPSSERS